MSYHLATACHAEMGTPVVDAPYSNHARQPKQPPKSGYGFLQAVVEGAISPAGDLIQALDAPHREGGNPGYPAHAMLSAYVIQFTLNERYANAFLNRLGSDNRLLAICGLEHAPSEAAYSRFKKKLANHLDVIQFIITEVFRECGEQIERLREAGIVPEGKPPLGHSLVIDSTDVEAWARPARKSRKTGQEIPSKDPNAKWGFRTAKNIRSSKPRSGKPGGSKKANEKGTASGTQTGQKESKDEFYFGYKVDVITDANYGLPMFAVTRPANASDVAVMVQDLDDCLALYRTLNPRYFLNRSQGEIYICRAERVGLGIAINSSAFACSTVRQRRLTSSCRWVSPVKKLPTFSRTAARVPRHWLAVASWRAQPQMASSALKSGL